MTHLTIPWAALASDNRRNSRRGGRAHGWDYRHAREAIRMLMMSGVGSDQPRFRVPVHVRYDFYPPDYRRRDVSNFLKILGDSGNGVVWEDDSLITSLSYLKHAPDGSDPRVEITVKARAAA
ncbi:MAG: hypothetical protein AMXMBFR53_36770 [Gemmatimonadota bacterium]